MPLIRRTTCPTAKIVKNSDRLRRPELFDLWFDMEFTILDGDLLDQNVEVIVNPWNRNIIPWWLLLPQGVSGAIKRRAGVTPFRELAMLGPIPLGGAVQTSAGRLPYKAIIHVAGINMLWRSSEFSVRTSTRNAMSLAKAQGYRSIAMPLIGAGSGGGNAAAIQRFIEDELAKFDSNACALLVRYRKHMPSRAVA